MIRFIDFGNIFKLEGVSNYAHGCNCAGAMGKGIALQFKSKFPKMYDAYKTLCKQNDFNLGDVFAYDYEDGVVFNLGTQKTWRTKADYKAIEKSLNNMLGLCVRKKIYHVALPRIGAGLGGANWNKVKLIIQKVASSFEDVNIYVVENYKDVYLTQEKIKTMIKKPQL
ncbi:MAG: macro domain-containing protein [Flavobacteriaceae bacterium]|nr:macro domain-containing protein [Flavobacteriaceae bacterium]